ncbi:MAG: F0F1 ATP synthase subunit B [Patescibacteria group bacterium]
MDIQIPQILFQIINFSVVTGALVYFLYKPLNRMLDDRSKKIEKAQRAADETIQEREKLETEKKNILQRAEREALDIIENAKTAGKKQKQEILEEAKKEAEAQIKKIGRAWESERKSQESQMREEFTDTVLLVTEKIIGKLDKKTKSKLIDSELKTILGKI